MEVDEDAAANVLLINRKIYYPSEFENIFIQNAFLKEKEKYPLPNYEFKKIDGSLTCRSVLF